ncbi:IclR family transcriptional regulator [Streptomyces antimicrobicus]|uniref:IclR family transcriptional regulator n=1 Tax=Streptomyces antimicrobicus TaxID=2883108 RepID=A0ABS8BEE4_9ACTN|nr:IclR family transcriptional regulator [Streptomyces antimicrobicus]MCB5182981.1 IclR family transcriptional regulator [Streptomyces antimicrobicus]
MTEPRAGRTSAAGTASEKSLRILEAVAAPGGPHRLAEVAAAAEVPRSSTHRILTALAEQGYVRTAGDGRYGVGPRLRSLAAQVAGAEPAGVERTLDELRRRTGQTVHLALYDGGPARGAAGDGSGSGSGSVTYVHKLESDQPFRTASRVGTRMPLHTTAIGKSVLAALPAEEVRALLGTGDLPRRTPRTLATVVELEAELAVVRQRGFALDDEENEPAIRCLGAAVLDGAGRPVGGVSVTTVTFLVPREQLETYGPAVREAAEALAPLLLP